MRVCRCDVGRQVAQVLLQRLSLGKGKRQLLHSWGTTQGIRHPCRLVPLRNPVRTHDISLTVCRIVEVA